MALDVEWVLSRSSVLLVNSLARSKSECLNFNALGALVAQPNRLQNRLFLANVTKPDDDVTEVDPDPEPDPAVLGHAGFAVDHRPLQLGGAAHRVDNAREFRQHPIAGCLDDASPTARP